MQIFQPKNAKIKFFEIFSQNILVIKKLFVTLQCEIKNHTYLLFNLKVAHDTNLV